MKLISDDPELGKFYHDEDSGVSVFEKTAGLDAPRFCAWEGENDEYDSASRSPWASSMEEAVGFLEFIQFRCSECGKIRARRSKKHWSDKCKIDGGHKWAPMPGKKKTQPGRKINMWMSDSQLLEIDQVCEETGNDRASTIRDLIVLGLKCRRQIDKFMGRDSVKE